MLAVLFIVLPIFALIAAGWGVGRVGVLGDGAASGAVGLLVALKLVAQPAATWAIARFIGLPAPATQLAVLIAALPTGTGPFMLAELYGRRADVTARTILVSTVLSLATITLYLVLAA